MRAGTAAALVAYATTALACSFAGERNQRPLPPGHPAIDSSAGAPDAMVPDLAGGRFVIPGGGITVARPGWGARSTVDLIDTMAKASIANGTGPLCYWSWQSLPPPQDPVHNPNWAARGKFNFTAMEQHVNPGSVTAIRDLCTYARGPAAVAGRARQPVRGQRLRRRLRGLHLDKAEFPARCAEGSPLYTQSWGLRWPMSVTMWKFDGTNKDAPAATVCRRAY